MFPSIIVIRDGFYTIGKCLIAALKGCVWCNLSGQLSTTWLLGYFPLQWDITLNVLSFHYFFLPPCFMYWAWRCRMMGNIPLVCWIQLSQLHPLPASCVSPAFLLAGQCEKLKSSWPCLHVSQQQIKHRCATYTVSIKNLKHTSMMQAAGKKINFIVAKARGGQKVEVCCL